MFLVNFQNMEIRVRSRHSIFQKFRDLQLCPHQQQSDAKTLPAVLNPCFLSNDSTNKIKGKCNFNKNHFGPILAPDLV